MTDKFCPVYKKEAVITAFEITGDDVPIYLEACATIKKLIKRQDVWTFVKDAPIEVYIGGCLLLIRP